MNRTRPLMLACLAVVMFNAVGCGYTHQSTFPDGIGSVQVKMLGNRTFYRGVEFDLTEALVKEIELRTPYKSVSREDADTVIEGTVVDVSQNRLSRTSTGGLPQEMEVKVTVDVEWRDRRSGRVLRRRDGLADVGTYKPAGDVAEPFEIAQHIAVQRLATKIVGVMRDDF